MEDALYWLWLADALGSGCAQAGLLLTVWPDPRRLYEYLRGGGLAPDFLSPHAAAALEHTAPADFAPRLDACTRASVAVLTPEDPDYPDRLRDLPDLPLALYATGRTAALNGRRYVGMVGTRRPTAYGRTACREISLALARQGVVIVSGLADGLDGAGHRAAVEAGAETVAFLGTAIDKTYPAANARLRAQIEQEVGGAVVSEYPPGYVGRAKGTFLARNRLIAGLSEVLCVAEARTHSGTLNTVAHAVRYARPVLAVPGSIFSPVSQGTNELLRTGRAGVLCGAQDVLHAIGLNTADPEGAMPGDELDLDALSEDARTVLGALGPRPLAPDEMCRATALPVHRVLAALTELELAGAAQPQAGGLYTAGA